MARKRKAHRFGSPPELHRARGVQAARRAIKIANLAMRRGCAQAPGLLVAAAMYAGGATAEAKGVHAAPLIGRREAKSYKTAERAERAVRRAFDVIARRCFVK